MKFNSLKILHLLEMIAEDKTKSQREFSDTLNISLGMVNAFIKRLVKKGYCKVTSLPRNRIKYMLTPSGAMEKTRLTYEYMASSYQYFKQVRNRLQNYYADLEAEGARRVVFYGAGELGDIAFLSMAGTRLELIDVIDPSKEGQRFAQFIVKSPWRLIKLDFDVLLVTNAEDHGVVIQSLQAVGVPSDKIRFF
jgi:DNA-binding MarR family transcriptional regulator